jgi:acyl-coenzyme A thioesterase PaaI-like protein
MESTLSKLHSIQSTAHPFCFVCSGANPFGLALQYVSGPDGRLQACFHANPSLEGYPGLLHGGVTAALLDGIMTNLLFSKGIVALTGELRIRYREPVEIGPEILLSAWIERQYAPLFVVRAELRQQDNIKAIASAKFMQRHE